MERTSSFPLTPRLVIGFTILWLGTFWFVDELGYHQVHPLLDLWPAGLVLLAIAIALSGGGWIATLIVGGIGVWLLGESLGLFRVDFGDLWPLILVFFGLRLIMKGAGIRSVAAGDRTDRINSIALFGNRDHRVETDDFRRGDATAILGTTTIDLTAARFPNEATIDLFCLMGGVHVIVSPDTRIISEVVPVMAGYEDKRTTSSGANRTLYLRGFAIWGGVEVTTGTERTEESDHA